MAGECRPAPPYRYLLRTATDAERQELEECQRIGFQEGERAFWTWAVLCHTRRIGIREFARLYGIPTGTALSWARRYEWVETFNTLEPFALFLEAEQGLPKGPVVAA